MPNDSESLLDVVLAVRREREAELLKSETANAEPEVGEAVANESESLLTD